MPVVAVRASIVGTLVYVCRDIAGDAAFVDAIRNHRDKAWVDDLVVPYAHAPARAGVHRKSSVSGEIGA